VIGAKERALETLERAVDGGFLASPTLTRDGRFDLLRGEPGFRELIHRADGRRALAQGAFRDAGGPGLLGLTPG
jgi:hypothetical protein